MPPEFFYIGRVSGGEEIQILPDDFIKKVIDKQIIDAVTDKIDIKNVEIIFFLEFLIYLKIRYIFKNNSCL